jgi:DNA-directed RNA polymerase specialized sigma24 family protein
VSVRDAFEALLAAATPLEAVRATRAATAELDASLLGLVRDALAAGASWTEVADAAGLTPAAAKWRWQGTDAEISARVEAGRKRSQRPSSVPTDLPGLSVAEAAQSLGITPQAVYLRVSRGQLRAETVTIADGRSYKRVFVSDQAAQ